LERRFDLALLVIGELPIPELEQADFEPTDAG
jgi:hypothetical protein